MRQLTHISLSILTLGVAGLVSLWPIPAGQSSDTTAQTTFRLPPIQFGSPSVRPPSTEIGRVSPAVSETGAVPREPISIVGPSPSQFSVDVFPRLKPASRQLTAPFERPVQGGTIQPREPEPTRFAYVSPPLHHSKVIAPDLPVVRREFPPSQPTPQARSLRKNGLMGQPEIRFFDVDAIKDFAVVRVGLVSDIDMLNRCRIERCDSDLGRLATRLTTLEQTDLGQINSLINAVPYRSDESNWGVADYWARPSEMLRRGGDCEDFALLKYAVLAAMGVSENQMRIVIGHTRDGTPHVVLSVQTGEGTVFLDNRADRPLHAKETDLRPRYSVNGKARWTHIRPRPDQRYASSAGATLYTVNPMAIAGP